MILARGMAVEIIPTPDARRSTPLRDHQSLSPLHKKIAPMLSPLTLPTPVLLALFATTTARAKGNSTPSLLHPYVHAALSDHTTPPPTMKIMLAFENEATA
jgi:hypothetical protein